MQTLELVIFRFCASSSHEYYFQTYPMVYDEHLSLYDVLSRIEDLGYDTSMGLRVQGMCVFDDVRLWDLVQDFGETLYLEPLSQKYASKDLALNKEAMFARYEWFFKACSFITPDHRYELYKFLWANTISLHHNPAYLGEGFFLYVQWLLEMYPLHFDTLIHTLAGAQSGVMSYAPIEHLIYIKKPNAPHITSTINALINQVMRFGICLGCGKAWIHELESLRLQPPPALHTASTPPTQASTQTPQHYMLFNAYTMREAIPLLASTKALLHLLQYPLITPSTPLLALGGYFERIIDRDTFIQQVAYNIALAARQNARLLCADTTSYGTMIWAFIQILHNPQVRDQIYKLYDMDLSAHAPIYIGELIAKSPSHIWDHSLLIGQTLASYPSSLLASHIDISSIIEIYGLENLTKSQLLDICATSSLAHPSTPPHTTNTIEQRLQGTWLTIAESKQDFSHLYRYNNDDYLKECAHMRFAGIDAGVDVLVVGNIELFRAFHTLATQSTQSIGRDNITTPTLFLPQVALLALGHTSELHAPHALALTQQHALA